MLGSHKSPEKETDFEGESSFVEEMLDEVAQDPESCPGWGWEAGDGGRSIRLELHSPAV